MPTAIVTGSGGLIGSESVAHFAEQGFDVIGLENDMRASFFGPEASTAHMTDTLSARFADAFSSLAIDIRDRDAVERVFAERAGQIELVVHTAAQPSHDWAAADPHTDFEVNALGTLNMLEATRRHADAATFVHCSTNKVYGDTPNSLPLVELERRLELPDDHIYYQGIDTSMSIDHSTHSLFGVSKTAADLLVQEYGRYFGLATVCFRGGCLTGPNHAGTMLHGFLSYLMRATVTGEPYTVFGYGGKQVRDNIHSADLVAAFEHFHLGARAGGAVYNIGGGRDCNCSMIEAIELCQQISGRELQWTLSEHNRLGDHRWWISDLRPFAADYPGWRLTRGLEQILRELHDHNAERWLAER
jgi:CDP-paratose 2-epimerase